ILETCPRQEDGQDLPHLQITGDALTCWATYHNTVERARRDGERLHPICEWGSKHPGRAARLAGVLHVATHGGPGDHLISLATMQAAVTLAEYFEPHALRAYDLLEAIPELAG